MKKTIQTRLAKMPVDLGGLYVMQRDDETALIHRLEAFKIICDVKNPDMKTVGQIGLTLKIIYEHTKQSKTIGYDRFLEKNGLAAVIESWQCQPLRKGRTIHKVKLRGIEKEFNWEFTGSPED